MTTGELAFIVLIFAGLFLMASGKGLAETQEALAER